jgi:Uma2 family endonuclease
MSTKTRRLITAEELWRMPEVPGRRFELVDGEVRELPGAGALHGLMVALLYELINTLARGRDLGLALPDGVGYLLRRDPDLIRIPDVSCVSWGRVPPEGVPERYWELAPDLAVEIVSPHDRASDPHDRAREYLEAGALLVWVLWPSSRAITMHEPGGLARELGPEDELTGGDVLPGFRAPVSALFDVRTRP